MKGFQDLEIYRKAYNLAIKIHEIWPYQNSNFTNKAVKFGGQVKVLRTQLQRVMEEGGIKTNSSVI